MSYRFSREFFGPSQHALTASSATTSPIPYRSAAGGVLFVDAAAGGATTITWWAAPEPGKSASQLFDASGNAITTAIAVGTSRSIPDALYGAHMLVPVLNAGTATVTFTGKS